MMKVEWKSCYCRLLSALSVAWAHDSMGKSSAAKLFTRCSLRGAVFYPTFVPKRSSQLAAW